MTSPSQLGQASEDSNKSPRHTRRRSAGRFPLPRKKRTWIGIMLSLIALAGVALAIDGGSDQATPGGTSAATGGAQAAPGSMKGSQVNQAPNSISKAKAKFPSAAQAAKSGGALSLPANMQSRVIAWQSGPGGAHLAAVTRLFGDALQAEGVRQYFAMNSACTRLTHSVSTAEAGPQIPVAAMQMLYGRALAELAKGAANCQVAIIMKPGDESPVIAVNATIRQQAAAELAAGARDIFRSTAEIEIAGRQSH